MPAVRENLVGQVAAIVGGVGEQAEVVEVVGGQRLVARNPMRAVELIEILTA
jgi:hypothetical protein